MRLDVELNKQLDGFRLQVELKCQSGILVLFGPSGAGKSLTLQCLAGIVRPDSGRIAVDDDVLYDNRLGIDVPPQKRQVGYVPQNYALFPHMTVSENIAFGLRRPDCPQNVVKVGQLLEMLHLGGLEKRHPRELSGGQQQRVALARALAVRPRLLLLDEPFSALDAPLRDALRTDLCDVHRELGVGIVFVTHGVAETHVMAQTVAVYQGGRVLQVGSPEEVFQRPTTAEVARLTGARNLLSGRVVESGIDSCRIAIGDRVRLWAPRGMLVPGTKVLVAIRSEYARFVCLAELVEDYEELVEGTVRSVESQGHLYAVQVAVGGAEGPTMQVLSPVWWWERNRLRPGDGCLVAIPKDSVHVLPSEAASIEQTARVHSQMGGRA